MAATRQLPEQIIHLIIRFTASIPDLPLSIQTPQTITTLSLKQLIRTHLASSYSSKRLRLIYAGKVLLDSTPLSHSLKLPPLPDHVYPSNNGKGKAPIRDIDSTGKASVSTSPNIYIHCSIGDTLSTAELSAEAVAAKSLEESLRSALKSDKTKSHNEVTDKSAEGPHVNSSSFPPGSNATVQGFDRLLSTGFTATEVAALRSQFLTNLSFTRTPDNMPSASELRDLEERWLDSTGQESGMGATAVGGGDNDVGAAAEGQGWGAGFGAEDGGLDDMLWGNVVGFFWPLGGLFWGNRENGLWSRRQQIAVFAGVLLNLVFGFLRMAT